VAVAVMVVALLATTVLWRATARRAHEWQARAVSQGVELDDANGTVDDLEGNLADVRDRLSKSEADAKALQTRLDNLSAEKAKVEDEKAGLQTANDRLGEVSRAINKALQGANACINQGVAFFQQLNAGALLGAAAQAEAVRVDGACQQAEADRLEANRLIDALPKS
jgi:chromosome segregation ATPase